jgi:hypothetical protein
LKAKLYSPVFVDIWEPDEYGSYEPYPEELSQRGAARYKDEIQAAMNKYREPGEAERGLMAYYDDPDTVNEKVRSMFIDVEIHGGELWGVTTLDVTEPLTPEELRTLRDYITGQFSDGWGEGFEQQSIRVDDGEINVHFWKHGELFLDTQERFSRRLGIDFLPDDFEQVVEAAVVEELDAAFLAEARQRLALRAQQNWDDFRNAPHAAAPENVYHQAVKVVAYRDANIFIKDYDGFTAEQINCLLQFANPVELIADYLDPKSDISEMPGILANILEEQENLKAHYALAADPSAPGFDERIQRLRDRLKDNYEVFKRDTMDQSKEGIFYSVPEIMPVMEAYGYFTQVHEYTESDVDFLLKFENPLELISDRWHAAPAQVAHTRIVDSIFNAQERTLQRGGYGLVPDEPDPAPAAPEPPQKAEATGEKTSVMDRIRQHATEQRERPNLPKDAPGRKKYDPEL